MDVQSTMDSADVTIASNANADDLMKSPVAAQNAAMLMIATKDSTTMILDQASKLARRPALGKNASSSGTAMLGEGESTSMMIANDDTAPPESTDESSSLRFASSPSRGVASSEEDSVAEMDYMSETRGYMSEGSNISLKSVPSAVSSSRPPGSLPTVSAFRPLPSSSDGDLNSSATDAAVAISHNHTIANASSTEAAAAAAAALYSTGPLLQRQHQELDQQQQQPFDHLEEDHRPHSLPVFRDPHTAMWTATHAANCPTEDRSASLVNILLQPLPPNFDSETQLPPLEPDYKTLLRLNLWCVIDGHGGGCVATYASEVLLPHIAASVSRALGCVIVDRGVCTVNGQLRDANALDLDGLIKTSSDRNSMGSNANSIQYRSSEFSEDEEDDIGVDGLHAEATEESETEPAVPGTVKERKQIASLAARSNAASIAGTLDSVQDASVSSVKTSVKTAASPAHGEALLGTHSPREVADITRAITESFLAVDEGWINSIDPVATHQTSCQSNGRWNSGACALVVFTIQRLDWTSISEPNREKGKKGPEKSRLNTSQNRDAARRRMLDYAARAKSATSSMSTGSSTSSLTTEEPANGSGPESEITETEGDDDRSHVVDDRRRSLSRVAIREANLKTSTLISPPGSCSCHCYRAHDAILYTAHVGDCRAVMLGSAPPRTIKVRDRFLDTTDDESSHHSSDETECLSSSDHDADSSEDDDPETPLGTPSGVATSTAPACSTTSGNTTLATTSTSPYLNFPRRVTRQKSSRRRASEDTPGPYIALPPLVRVEQQRKAVQFDFETSEVETRDHLRTLGKDLSVSSESSQDSLDCLPLVHLPPSIRPIDLTTDHSAYNPAEVTAVLRRCNNAPRAISAGVGGGIKRVAGSLAVTRALGDAYLKTPLLSFLPYKSHAPYITARPEVNCRPLVKEGDKVLILATDGVWERAGGEDVLRWVRNFYEERVAELERRNSRRSNLADKNNAGSSSSEDPANESKNAEGAERDLFEKNDIGDAALEATASNGSNRKREHPPRSPSPPTKRRKRGRQSRISYNVADVIARRVLNKVRRARNISSLQALMSLPQGRARRSKHDDITASVVDLSAFVS